MTDQRDPRNWDTETLAESYQNMLSSWSQYDLIERLMEGFNSNRAIRDNHRAGMTERYDEEIAAEQGDDPLMSADVSGDHKTMPDEIINQVNEAIGKHGLRFDRLDEGDFFAFELKD